MRAQRALLSPQAACCDSLPAISAWRVSCLSFVLTGRKIDGPKKREIDIHQVWQAAGNALSGGTVSSWGSHPIASPWVHKRFGRIPWQSQQQTRPQKRCTLPIGQKKVRKTCLSIAGQIPLMPLAPLRPNLLMPALPQPILWQPCLPMRGLHLWHTMPC